MRKLLLKSKEVVESFNLRRPCSSTHLQALLWKGIVKCFWWSICCFCQESKRHCQFFNLSTHAKEKLLKKHSLLDSCNKASQETFIVGFLQQHTRVVVDVVTCWSCCYLMIECLILITARLQLMQWWFATNLVVTSLWDSQTGRTWKSSRKFSCHLQMPQSGGRVTAGWLQVGPTSNQKESNNLSKLKTW